MIVCETYRDAPYGELLALQRERFSAMVERRRRGLPVEREWIMAVEHRPVYTLGRHGAVSNLLDPGFLRERGIDLVEIERGGDITFHGPGQLVVYPLIDLAARGLGVKGYVEILEDAVIATLADYGIAGERLEGATGVWIDPHGSNARKICAIGIKCSRFVTMHGLALNVTTDLGYFNMINPCGFTDRGVTSIINESAHGNTSAAPEINWESAAAILTRHLLDRLQ